MNPPAEPDVHNLLAQVPEYDLWTIVMRFIQDYVGSMFGNNRIKALLAALSIVCLLAIGPAQAGLMGFTIKSLETENSGGC